MGVTDVTMSLRLGNCRIANMTSDVTAVTPFEAKDGKEDRGGVVLMARDCAPKSVTSVTPQAAPEIRGVTRNVTDYTGSDDQGNATQNEAVSDQEPVDLFNSGFDTAWDVQQRRIDALLAENDELRERIDELEDELYYEENRANCFEDEAEAAWEELGY